MRFLIVKIFGQVKNIFSEIVDTVTLRLDMVKRYSNAMAVL